MIIKVKDIVEYLLKQDQEAEVFLDHDGWYIDDDRKTPQEIIKDRGLFYPHTEEGKKYLTIQN